MSGEKRGVQIERLSTGIPGLDEVLGGGLPEYSFNLIAGAPGSGKTTMAHQIVFANASADRPALYFTILGEPPLKMLRYQQQLSFFDSSRIGDAIRFINLSQVALEGDLSKVLDAIIREVEESNPAIVVIDSFRTVARLSVGGQPVEQNLQGFAQRLAVHLTNWQATTFLVGEYLEAEMRDNPVFTVADGILWLYQSVERNSIVRKLQVLKLRGQASMPGLHTFRITGDGLQVYPRIPQHVSRKARPRRGLRVASGVPGLDAMLGGGIPSGDSVVVAGPSGSGKTVLAAQIVAEGVHSGEPGVIAVFEEHPEEYLERARSLGFDLEAMIAQGKLRVIYLRPLDLSVDETLQGIRDAVDAIGAKRVVVDSISGFELALAPAFREDFRESLYRMVGALTGVGITVLLTIEVVEIYSQLSFTGHEISFLADDIVLLRYVEIDGLMRKVMTVAKMRGSDHSKELRAYEITARGFEVGATLSEYRGIITGVPERLERPRPTYPGLTDQEAGVLRVLVQLREGSDDAVAQAMSVRSAALTSAFDRLVTLGYAIRATEGNRVVYRPVARELGG